MNTYMYMCGHGLCSLFCCDLNIVNAGHWFSGGDQRTTGKGKRQAWTAAAIEAFFEGLYQVHMMIT